MISKSLGAHGEAGWPGNDRRADEALTSHHCANSRLYMEMGRLVDSRGWNRREVATQATHKDAPMLNHTAGSTSSSDHTPNVDAAQVAVDVAEKPIIARTTPAHMERNGSEAPHNAS